MVCGVHDWAGSRRHLQGIGLAMQLWRCTLCQLASNMAGVTCNRFHCFARKAGFVWVAGEDARFPRGSLQCNLAEASKHG